MDTPRFDALSKRLAAPRSRRQVAQGLAAGLLAFAGARQAEAKGRCKAPTSTLCGKGKSALCVDLSSDVANCGACGNACASGQGCCGGVCTDLSSVTNCGGCGIVCASGQTCANGTCAGCAAGQTLCGDVCVYTTTDPSNCGRCGNDCALAFPHATAICNSSTCVFTGCTAGYANCDNDWSNGCESDLSTDPNNCGSCGIICPLEACNGSTCSGGTCGPVVPINDGQPCGPERVCSNGACICDPSACPVGSICALSVCGGSVECCRAPGTACDPAHPCECCNALCSADGVCQCSPPGDNCSRGATCCSGSCNGNGFCD